MIQDRIKILGTIFTRDRSETSKANLAQVVEKIEKSCGPKGQHLTGIMGKIILVNTVIYPQLYHRAWIIKCEGTEYQSMQKKLATYLVPRKRKVLQTLARTKKMGGLGLINITERLEAIKIKHISNGDYDAPETDNLKFYLGTKIDSVHKLNTGPPHAESYPHTHEATLKTLYKNVETLGNLQELKVRQIENKIYTQEGMEWDQQIFRGKLPRQVFFNYKVLHEMVYLYGQCTLFRTENHENAEHLFLKCESLAPLRREASSWIRTILKTNFKMNYGNIVEMKGSEDHDLYYIVSEYKYQVWLARNKVKYDDGELNVKAIEKKISNQMQFYFNYVDTV